ncbi:hypothetical protein ACQU0X_22245 [Pseudovibrio ascidiaceicola]|uniref:hypothetical protein n=1 Tax=Pseudovibrio ascidiaceicola TaxID=285279 RepID=UPI003D35BF87
MVNFQRKGAASNTQVGREFECRARQILEQKGLKLGANFKVPCGLGNKKKDHNFDLGSNQPSIIVECKSQTWTETGNIPSAKMKNWAEAMFYFHMAPKEYRKIFFVEKSVRPTNGETLLDYFKRTQAHMIPDDVELWELDSETDNLQISPTRPTN